MSMTFNQALATLHHNSEAGFTMVNGDGTPHITNVRGFAMLLALSHGLDVGEAGEAASWRKDGLDYLLEGQGAGLKTRATVRYEAREREQLEDMTDPGGGPDPHDLGHTLFIHAPTVVGLPPILALAEAIRLRLKEQSL